MRRRPSAALGVGGLDGEGQFVHRGRVERDNDIQPSARSITDFVGGVRRRWIRLLQAGSDGMVLMQTLNRWKG